MKTKVVQHVERELMREWENERVGEWEIEIVTVGHRHEKDKCSPFAGRKSNLFRFSYNTF